MARPITVMAGSSVGSWAVISVAGGGSWNPEFGLGMIGPLVSAVLTWLFVARTHRQAPERVTAVLIAGFAIKMLFFGAYIALLAALGMRLRPFVASFAVYFIALHTIEAGYLRRLFAGGAEPVTPK
jgi:hypothetical protein